MPVPATDDDEQSQNRPSGVQAPKKRLESSSKRVHGPCSEVGGGRMSVMGGMVVVVEVEKHVSAALANA